MAAVALALALGSLAASPDPLHELANRHNQNLKASGSPIKHVVVLYEENRAFDHIFGHNKKLKAAGADCLTGNESNPRSLTDPSKGRVKVLEGAPYVATIDPNHGKPNRPAAVPPAAPVSPSCPLRCLSGLTAPLPLAPAGMPQYTLKIFGNSTFTNKLEAPQYMNNAVATMEGFFAYEDGAHKENETDADFVMRGFAPEQLPVTTMLAEEFAVFDSWFAAFPGPSWPNHLYSITGTSAGCTETSDMFHCTKGPAAKQFPQPTIFDSLQEAGHDWMMIYNDSKHES